MTCITVTETLLAQLSTTLGARSARQEFKWMKDHARDIQALQGMVHRRLKGEPLQYILGTQPFGSLDLQVRAPVLIPRTETEDWTIRLARLVLPTLKLRPRTRRVVPLKLLDLCTGSGCIPLLLCHMWPSNSVHAFGVDVTNEAIALANDNADRTKERLNENSVSFLRADILHDSFPRTLKELGWSPVDVLTSNPPYIPLHEYNVLPSSVRDYEDPRALLGDPSQRTAGDGRGLTFYRRIADLIRDGLVNPGGHIALEVGHDQSKEVEDIMQSQANVRSTEIWDDPFGIPRTVVCTK